jgi:hypothetical protein
MRDVKRRMDSSEMTFLQPLLGTSLSDKINTEIRKQLGGEQIVDAKNIKGRGIIMHKVCLINICHVKHIGRPRKRQATSTTIPLVSQRVMSQSFKLTGEKKVRIS